MQALPLSGSHANRSCEHASEGKRQLGIAQQIFRPIYSPLQQPLMRSHVGRLTECAGEVVTGQPARAGYLRHGDLAVEIGVVSVWCGPDGGRQGSLCADVPELPGSDGVEAQAGDGLLAGVSRPYGGQSQEARGNLESRYECASTSFIKACDARSCCVERKIQWKLRRALPAGGTRHRIPDGSG